MGNQLRFLALLASAYLVLHSAALFARDDKRDSLWTAVRAGDVKAIEAALDKGADINAKNEMGVSALWIAASKGKQDVIELLIKRGADVNARDGIWYQTPLSTVTSTRKLESAKLLIKSGARDVDTALHLAVTASNEAMVKMILEESKSVRMRSIQHYSQPPRTRTKNCRKLSRRREQRSYLLLRKVIGRN